MRNLLLVLGPLALVLASGCATAPSEEASADSRDAISKKSAYEAVIDAKVFRSGHSTCGRVLKVAPATSTSTSGTYELDVSPCDDDGDTTGDARHSEGTFTVVGGWFGGHLTDPTMHMTPSEGSPWKLEVSEGPEGSVILSDADGTLVPEGFLD